MTLLDGAGVGVVGTTGGVPVAVGVARAKRVSAVTGGGVVGVLEGMDGIEVVGGTCVVGGADVGVPITASTSLAGPTTITWLSMK